MGTKSQPVIEGVESKLWTTLPLTSDISIPSDNDLYEGKGAKKEKSKLKYATELGQE